MSDATFTVLADRAAEPIEAELDGWVKVEGSPTMTTWIEYTAKDGSMICGWWKATPGTYRARYEAWEFVHLLEGRIVITPDGEEPRTVGPGDAFVVEKGFNGTWRIDEPVLKHFAIKLE